MFLGCVRHVIYTAGTEGFVPEIRYEGDNCNTANYLVKSGAVVVDYLAPVAAFPSHAAMTYPAPTPAAPNAAVPETSYIVGRPPYSVPIQNSVPEKMSSSPVEDYSVPVADVHEHMKDKPIVAYAQVHSTFKSPVTAYDMAPSPNPSYHNPTMVVNSSQHGQY